MKPNRRQVLQGLLSIGPWLPSMAMAAGGSPEVPGCFLSWPGAPNPRPEALASLLQEVEAVTSVVPAATVPSLSPEDDALFGEPFAALFGDRALSPLSSRGVERLSAWLQGGGFLFIEDCSGREDSPFDVSVRRELKRIFPDRELAPLGREHALFRSFFLLKGVSGRFLLRPYLEGITVGGLSPVVYSRNDLGGAWVRGRSGAFQYEVVPGGDRQRMEALKLGINLYIYALTGNYKLDAVHVRTLLKRMKDEGRIP